MRDSIMSNRSYHLENKVVLVTGGSRGIGLEITRALLEQNARVSVCGRKQEGLDRAKAELAAEDRLLAVRAHVAKEEDVQNLFDTTVNHFGQLDVLINNVGMNLLTGAFIDTELAVWQKIIDSNLTGAFLCSRMAAKIMRGREEGKIVSISSVAGRRAAPGMGIYGIAKAGLEMMTRVLALELSQYNIQVNAVAPGMVRTDFSKPFWSNEEILAHAVKAIPLGRIAEPMDVVHLVLFLCSDVSNYITGQTIMVDGGSTAI
jgi:NAD(P)-dependent dehydrogenase (short-subunit alcohol dehydrogenase family)